MKNFLSMGLSCFLVLALVSCKGYKEEIILSSDGSITEFSTILYPYVEIGFDNELTEEELCLRIISEMKNSAKEYAAENKIRKKVESRQDLKCYKNDNDEIQLDLEDYIVKDPEKTSTKIRADGATVYKYEMINSFNIYSDLDYLNPEKTIQELDEELSIIAEQYTTESEEFDAVVKQITSVSLISTMLHLVEAMDLHLTVTMPAPIEVAPYATSIEGNTAIYTNESYKEMIIHPSFSIIAVDHSTAFEVDKVDPKFAFKERVCRRISKYADNPTVLSGMLSLIQNRFGFTCDS